VWEVDWEGEEPSGRRQRAPDPEARRALRPADAQAHEARRRLLRAVQRVGSQIIAAEQEGRRVYAMELSPVFVDVAVRRWEQFTGQRAELEGGAS
jgi:hypothetical protein